MSDRAVFDGTWFGPAPADHEAAEAAFRAARDPFDVLRAGVDLCKLGDFSTRDVLIDMLQEIRDPAFRMEAQDVVLAIARHDDLVGADTTSYLARVDLDVAEQFAGSASAMLAKAAVPLLLAMLEEADPASGLRASAFSGLSELLRLDEPLHEDSDVDVLAVEAQARMHAVDASYMLDGAAFSPAPMVERMTAYAMRAVEQGTPFTNALEATRLSVWSGRRCPRHVHATITQADVRALVAYATDLAGLSWQPGVKYFSGHPVDGGPSLAG